MTVASMTGYARAAGEHGAYRWTWEVKSVNSRALDLRIRLPAGYDRLEMMAREAISARLKRGAVSVSLDVARTEGGTPLQINRELLDQLIELHGELGDSVSGEPPRLESLLAVKGVVEAASETEDAGEIKVRDAAIMGSFGEALDALETARSEEGGRLGDILVGHVDTIEGLCRDAGDAAGASDQGDVVGHVFVRLLAGRFRSATLTDAPRYRHPPDGGCETDHGARPRSSTKAPSIGAPKNFSTRIAHMTQ